MKTLNLAFTDTHPHIANFFYNILKEKYNIILNSNDPDFLIFGDENFGTNNKNFSKKDCVKIFYTGENRRPENYNCHYAITFDHINNNWHYRLPLFIIYMWALKFIHKTCYEYDYIFNPSICEKTRFCSFVVSNPNSEMRNNFFQILNDIITVDSAGKYKNNTNITLNTEEDKIKFLQTRKFNICFESYSHPGYVTEKLLHAFYAKTIPIYWGSSTVNVDFNSKAFINISKFNTISKAIDYVLKVNSDDTIYEELLYQPAFTNNSPPDYYNLTKFLDWFDYYVYNKRDPK